ncbi:MAG: hypothetical protein ACR2QL_07925 [Woeseiaceae bacterium]
MTKIVSILCGGILVGVLATLAAVQYGQPVGSSPDNIVRDIDDVPQMTHDVAEKHRDEQYASIDSVEQVLALPTEFARSEAMYVLAGRSGSGDVQNLIFEANRIADDIERVRLLEILFFQLAEADPRSALALVRTDDFQTSKTFEQTVWRAWARKDLGDALFSAKTQTSTLHQHFAAQSLFAAFGYLGNETTDRIQAELGIGPDRRSRSRFIYQLADKSPAEAIEFVNNVERGDAHRDYVSWLAYYLSMYDPHSALGYANLFDAPGDVSQFERIVNSHIANADPKAAIERMLATGGGPNSGEYHRAVSLLAAQDLDAIKQFYENARSADDRRFLGQAIIQELISRDPIEALAWARANDTDRMPHFELSALSHIAQTDPQLALTEALNSQNNEMRSMLVSNVLQHIARYDPQIAVGYLEQIPDEQQRRQTSRRLVSSWAQEDPDAAIDWILSQDDETTEELIQQVGHRLVDSDIDAAIRLLPRLEGQNQTRLGQEIAQSLATNRSVEEAQTFVRQFEGQPGYDQLQASVIAGIAQTDVMMAKQYADQLAAGNARDSAYVQIIDQHAGANPIEASRWLASIGDENYRGAAAGQLASRWYANDPTAATRWVTNLPAGSTRDDAIMQMSYRWSDATAAQNELIASIDDRDKRGQAKIRQIYHVMRTDPERAKAMLEDEDIPSYQRQQIEAQIGRTDPRLYRSY